MEVSTQRDARLLIERINREYTFDGLITGTKLEVLVNNCLGVYTDLF